MSSTRILAVGILMAALAAQAGEPERKEDHRVSNAVIVGAFGLAAAGGYTLGAYLTGDQPSGATMAVLGAVGAGGALGWWLGFAINAALKQPSTFAGFILLPLLTGVAGAVLGGVAAGFSANQPGAGRTATHGVVIGVLLTDTIIGEIVAIAR